MRRPPAKESIGYFWLCVSADARCYRNDWWKHRGFWSTFSYRVRRLRKLGPAYCRLLLPLDFVLSVYRAVVGHCELPAGARIGPGLFLPHPDGVILSDQCRLGCEVTIFQQVTVGCWHNASPRIHSRTAIFAGAKVIGPVTLWRASVGANAVVTRDVPSCHVAVGIPAVARPVRNEELQEASANPSGALRSDADPSANGGTAPSSGELENALVYPFVMPNRRPRITPRNKNADSQ